MIEREKFIKQKEEELFILCLGQKYSKPTQMFSVSVLEIFLDTKNKFYMISFLVNQYFCFLFFFHFIFSYFFFGDFKNKYSEKKESVQTPFTKDKLSFSFLFSLSSFFFVFKYHKISSFLLSFHVNFMSDFFFNVFYFLLLMIIIFFVIFNSICFSFVSTYKNTPPTSLNTRITIKRFTKRLHQIFTVYWRKQGRMLCGDTTAWILRLRCLRHRACCCWWRWWWHNSWWWCSQRARTCCWACSIGHMEGHSHFWLNVCFKIYTMMMNKRNLNINHAKLIIKTLSFIIISILICCFSRLSSLNNFNSLLDFSLSHQVFV